MLPKDGGVQDRFPVRSINAVCGRHLGQNRLCSELVYSDNNQPLGVQQCCAATWPAGAVLEADHPRILIDLDTLASDNSMSNVLLTTN